MKLITLLCAISLLTACQGTPNHNFTISGKIKNYTGEIIALIKNDVTTMKDTTYKIPIDANGNFKFTIKTKEQDFYLLTWGKKLDKDNFIVLVNDVPDITIDGDANNKNSFIVKKSKTTNTIVEIQNVVQSQKLLLNQYINTLDSINALPNKNNIVNDYDLKIKALQANNKTKLLDYYNKADNNAFIQVAVLGNMSDIYMRHSEQRFDVMDINKEELLNLLNQSIKKYPNNKYFALFKEGIALHDKKESSIKNDEEIKSQLPSFSLPNTEGKIISIDTFKGQYFLLDFWASWCGPCRQENPYLVKAFNRFKNKNFTIVGVSLDDDKDAWLNAIAKDNLAWTHLSDLKGWENQAAQLFHINAIPFNLLVDPQGNIIASELRGEVLEQKLEKILK